MHQYPTKPEHLFFANTDIEWVRRKWALIREYHQIADRANAKYRRISAELNDYLDRSYITDMVQRARIRGESLPLMDAIEEGAWFRREAQAHAEDLGLYLKLKELGLL